MQRTTARPSVDEPDPRTRPYQPFGGALELFYSQEDELLFEGPAGTGKTRGVLEKVHLCLLKYSGARALISRKTRVSMTESVLVTYESKVLPEESPIKSGASRAQRHSYTYPNGSELVCGGLDNPDRIMSTEYDIVVVFEATEAHEDDWEKLTSRLRNGVIPYQQAIADCNPGTPSHWLNQRALKKLPDGRPVMKRVLSRHEDNPSVSAGYLAKLDRLTGARKLRLRNGIWAQQEGVVYDEFDSAIHLLKRFEIPEDWRRYRVVDFGFTNPFVCQWWAEDPDGRLYMYREMYHTQRTVRTHAPQILALSEGETITTTVADHDAEDRATLKENGIRTIAARKDVSKGIQDVKERLKVQEDGKPRLYLLEDSLVERDESLVETKRPTSTREEIDGYAWPKGSNGRELKEAPIKSDDHGMDCIRYMVAYANRPRSKAY